MDAAIAELERATVLAPSRSPAHARLARALLAARRCTEALEPHQATNRVRMPLERGATGEAVAGAEALLAEHPENQELRCLLDEARVVANGKR